MLIKTLHVKICGKQLKEYWEENSICKYFRKKQIKKKLSTKLKKLEKRTGEQIQRNKKYINNEGQKSTT